VTEPIRLFDATPGLACLSIAAFVTTCAFPPPREAKAGERTMSAFFALLEARGHTVSLAPHPAFTVRRRAWTAMTKERRNEILDKAAYRLLSRRLAAVPLSFLLSSRPETLSVDDVLAARGRVIAAGRRVAGRYVPKDDEYEPDPANVRRDVWKATRPVLHLAYAIKAELDGAELTAWDWPALALMEGQQERIRRMVAAAETWRTALQRPHLGARDAAGCVEDAEQLRLTL
jgi:hypothetical protein